MASQDKIFRLQAHSIDWPLKLTDGCRSAVLRPHSWSRCRDEGRRENRAAPDGGSVASDNL